MSTRVEKLAFLNDRLARRRGFLEAVLQSIQEGVLVVSAEGAVVYANRTAETMLGFESEHARGRPVERFLPDVDWAALARNGGGAWDGVSSLELEVLRPQRRILSVTAFPLAAGDAAAEEPGAVAILRDVTREREDAREALASQNARDMRMWAAQLAHEIGNPLNAISLNLQLMDRSVAGLPEGPDREDLAESLRISRDEVSRLDGLLRNSLNALRGGAPNLVPCDVLAVLQRALGTLRADIQEQGVSVDVAAPARLPPIPGDAEQLQQVFFNLVKNAVQAMSEGGRLAIALSADDRDLTVAFRDTGSGIAPEDFRRLFEPFHTTKSGGHGIGLAVVKRIVDAHGGRIDVSSKPGEGTCFRLVFPLATRRARRLPPPPAAR